MCVVDAQLEQTAARDGESMRGHIAGAVAIRSRDRPSARSLGTGWQRESASGSRVPKRFSVSTATIRNREQRELLRGQAVGRWDC